MVHFASGTTHQAILSCPQTDHLSVYMPKEITLSGRTQNIPALPLWESQNIGPVPSTSNITETMVELPLHA
jgi:hypothetical protein